MSNLISTVVDWLHPLWPVNVAPCFVILFDQFVSTLRTNVCHFILSNVEGFTSTSVILRTRLPRVSWTCFSVWNRDAMFGHHLCDSSKTCVLNEKNKSIARAIKCSLVTSNMYSRLFSQVYIVQFFLRHHSSAWYVVQEKCRKIFTKICLTARKTIMPIQLSP
jgi:hypothetical protein